MLAYWVMGDGSNTKDHNSQKITLSCESFSEKDQKFLVKRFKKIGIEKTKEEIFKADILLFLGESKSDYQIFLEM